MLVEEIKMRTKRIGAEERERIISEIKTLTKQGITAKEACSQLGVNRSLYYNWVSQRKKKNPFVAVKQRRKKTPLEIIDLPQVPSTLRAVVFTGSPKDVASAIRELS